MVCKLRSLFKDSMVGGDMGTSNGPIWVAGLIHCNINCKYFLFFPLTQMFHLLVTLPIFKFSYDTRKNHIIVEYEISLSQFATKAGIPSDLMLGSLCIILLGEIEAVKEINLAEIMNLNIYPVQP